MSGPRRVSRRSWQKHLTRDQVIQRFPVLDMGTPSESARSQVNRVFEQFAQDPLRDSQYQPPDAYTKIIPASELRDAKPRIMPRYEERDPDVPTPYDHCYKCRVAQGNPCQQGFGCAYRLPETVAQKMINGDYAMTALQRIDKIPKIIRPGWVAVHQYDCRTNAGIHVMETSSTYIQIVGLKWIPRIHNIKMDEKIEAVKKRLIK